MDINKKILIGIVVLGLTINFTLVPMITRQKAKGIVTRVFDYWTIGDNASGVKYFQDKEKFPPIYDLQSYEITDVKFEKENGKLLAKYWVVLKLPPGNLLPSGKTWYCELSRPGRSWMIKDLYMIP